MRFTLQALLLISVPSIPTFIMAGFSTDAMSEKKKKNSEALGEMLFKAVEANSIDVVRSIVKSGVNLSYTNLNGQSAIDIAIDRNYFKIAQFLVFARRLEQQSTPENLPTVNIIQQITPEAAPIVEISRISRKSSETQKTKQNTIAKVRALARNLPTYDQSLKTYKNHTDRSISEKKPSIKVSNSIKISKEKKTVSLISTAKGRHFKENYKPVDPPKEKIKKVQRDINKQTHSLSMDIEPRKSFFIPKPRKKPPPNKKMAPR